jgi:heat shock protein HslJ
METTGAGKMRKIIALGISNVLLLTGCQTTTPTAPEPEVYFTARGNEPGWIIRFDTKKIAFEGDYGATKITVAKPEGRPSFNGMRYITDRLTVDVTHATCADVMSGQRYAETVTVMANGKEYKGCGGRNLPPESLDGTIWTIVMIDQLPVLEDISTELRFADGKVSGSGGCNRISGSYTTQGGEIEFGAIASTRMMCPEKQMAQEAKLLTLLKGKVTTRYTVDGDLILANESGQRATFKQVI